MQIQKEYTRKRILDVAQSEFLENGFQKTSMRMIAKKCDMNLSNIYNYFRNKDEIFTTILKPLTDKFEQQIIEHNKSENLTIEVFYSDEFQKNKVIELINLAVKFKPELDLLFFKSGGSSLVEYKDKLIDRHTEIGIEYIKLMNKKYVEINASVSDFFVHLATAWWLNVLEEIVMHDYKGEDLQQFIEEYVSYSTAGWHKLMTKKTKYH